MVSTYLLVGATGLLGKHIANAVLDSGNKLKVILRKKDDDSKREELVGEWKNKGAEIVEGSFEDKQLLEKALDGVDVFVSAVGSFDIEKQYEFLPLLKEQKGLKRFIPSEFGFYYEGFPNAANNFAFSKKYALKQKIRESGIPYTFVTTGFFTEILADFSKNVLVEDGNRKSISTPLADVGKFTVLASLDDRTLNTEVVFDQNRITQNEVLAAYEKGGNKLEKNPQPVTAEQLEKTIADKIANSDFNTVFYDLLTQGLWVYQGGLPQASESSKVLLLTNLYPNESKKTVEDFFQSK